MQIEKKKALVVTICIIIFLIILSYLLPSIVANKEPATLILAAFLTIMLWLFVYAKYSQKAAYAKGCWQGVTLLNALNKMMEQLESVYHLLVQEKKQAEDANIAKSTFIVNISHELRTPMHAILNYADVGKEYCESGNEKIAQCFAVIEEGGERLLTLINNLLDLARLESGQDSFKFEKNDMVACINYVQREMAASLEKKSISIIIKNEKDKVNAVFDKDHIIRVLVNLLSNAIKFSPKDGTITISLEMDRFDMGGDKKSVCLKVSVEDQGPGIEENEEKIIFTKFKQGSRRASNETSSGIGLAVCREIIAAHDGVIWAENSGHGGARVSFAIPYRAK